MISKWNHTYVYGVIELKITPSENGEGPSCTHCSQLIYKSPVAVCYYIDISAKSYFLEISKNLEYYRISPRWLMLISITISWPQSGSLKIYDCTRPAPRIMP